MTTPLFDSYAQYVGLSPTERAILDQFSAAAGSDPAAKATVSKTVGAGACTGER